MTLTNFFKSTLRLFYQLTVGLTVHLIRAGLLYVICVVTLGGWVVTVAVVTWRAYHSTGRHLGWTLGAGALTWTLYGVVIVAGHRVVRDWLGLTTLSLSQIFHLLFVGKRPAPPPGHQDGKGGCDGGEREGERVRSESERVNVKVTRSRKVMVDGSSSTVEKSSTDSWR